MISGFQRVKADTKMAEVHDHKTKLRFKSHGRRGGPRKHSERMADTNYALSMQLQNSSEARRQMISGFQQVKADATDSS